MSIVQDYVEEFNKGMAEFTFLHKIRELEKTLKSCPFCGGKGRILDNGFYFCYPYYVICDTCGCQVSCVRSRNDGDSREQMVMKSLAAWEMRVEGA